MNLRKRNSIRIECVTLKTAAVFIPRYIILPHGNKSNIIEHYFPNGIKNSSPSSFWIYSDNPLPRLSFFKIKELLGLDDEFLKIDIQVPGIYRSKIWNFVLCDGWIVLIDTIEKFEEYPIEQFYTPEVVKYHQYLIK